MAVNSAIGCAPNSQHCTGEAADLQLVDNALLFNLIRQHLPFDQPTCGTYRAEHNRKEVLRMKVIDKSNLAS